MKYILLFIVLISWNTSHGMAPDGTHTHDDYVELSYDADEFDAACAVVDTKTGVSMTGVLVAPDIVVTAAHGIEAIFNKLKPTMTKGGMTIIALNSTNVYFRGRDGTQMAKVSHVLIDPRYFQDNLREGKFDFAFLKLANPVDGIEPAKLFEKETIPSNALMTVVTYGTSDLDSGLSSIFSTQPVRRAFRLYERDTYFGRADDEEVLKSSRYLQESSVYFKPLRRNTKPEETDAEEIVRSFEATQNWVADGKKPYGLGLPGTSGSPVFIRLIKDGRPREYLFALVSSYSHLSGQFHTRGNNEMNYILSNQKESLGGYQTIFSLFYRNKTDEVVERHSAVYAQDPIFNLLLRNVYGYYGADWNDRAKSRGRQNKQKPVATNKSGFWGTLLSVFN